MTKPNACTMLSRPLKLWGNEPMKETTWDRLPLTTKSNFTLLNLIRPLNKFKLQPLCHASPSNIYFLFSCPARFPPTSHAPVFLTSSLSSPVSRLSDSVLFSSSSSSLPSFFLALELRLPLRACLSISCHSPYQSPWYLVLLRVRRPYYSAAFIMSFGYLGLPCLRCSVPHNFQMSLAFLPRL